MKQFICAVIFAGFVSCVLAYSDDWIDADGVVESIARGDGSRAYVFTNGTVSATVKTPLLVTQYLVVGGGGGGGNTMGGGGGGGGVVYNDAASFALAAEDAFSLTVGAGGTYGSTGNWGTSGLTGGNSSLTIGDETITAYGGGGGGSWDPGNARNGGSGGGSTRSCTPGTGVSGQGFGGGQGTGSSQGNTSGGGGGGGASEPGYASSTANRQAGRGGEGRSIAITGTAVVYGSGGGGGGSGSGFGTYDANVGGTNAGNGTKNGNGGRGVDGTGGGGGGGGWNSAYLGGIGGCGTVIVVLEPPSNELSLGTPYTVSVSPDEAVVNVKLNGLGEGAASATVTYFYGKDPENLDHEKTVVENQMSAGIFGTTLADLEPFATWYVKAEAVNDLEERIASAVISFSASPTYEDSMVAASDDSFIRTELEGGAYAYIFTNVSKTAVLRVKGSYTMSESLVVGGGGGGGNTMGGGGGGGGVVYDCEHFRRLVAGSVIRTGVGAGGKYGSLAGHAVSGTNGGSSTLTVDGEEIVAYGGGGGGSFDQPDPTTAGRGGYGYGRDGASGGGSTRDAAGGAAIDGQGNAGARGMVAANGYAGGGGGALEAGSTASTSPARSGKGGEGLTCAISGESVVYGSGGGGGGSSSGYGNCDAGSGGTNAGSGSKSAAGGNGVNGTGGGGGGGGWSGASQLGGLGGSGTVIFVLEPTDDTLRVGTPVVEKIEADGFTVSVKVGGFGEGTGSSKVVYRYGVDPDDLYRAVTVAEPMEEPGTVRFKLTDAAPAFHWYLQAEVENDLHQKMTSSVIDFTTGGVYLRFTFTGGSTMCQLSELAFYDANTNRINTGIVQTNSNVAANEMLPGYWKLSKALGTGGTETPAKIFDGNTATKQCVTSNGNFPYSYTFRFAADKRPALYNMATANDHCERSPTGWYVELSRDGFTWEEVDRKSGFSYPGTTYTWFAGSGTPWPFSTPFEWLRFVLGTISPQEYHGVPVEPKVSVRGEVDGKLLEEDVDYTLSYGNNNARGTATVFITGIGDYAGTKGDVNFEIYTPSLSATAATRAVETADEPPYMTSVTVKDGETDLPLVEGSDYVLVYSNNTDYGLGEVRVVGTNAYQFADAIVLNYAICGIVRVTPDAGEGGDGRSWASPMKFMAALEAVRGGGGVMWLKSGTYTDVSMSETETVSNAVSVIGGFLGNEASAAERPSDTVSTIDGGNARNLLRLSNLENAALEFERIVFTRAHTRALYKSGAGDLVISGCVFRANGLAIGGKPQSSADGRGVYAAGSSTAKVRITDTEFGWQHASGSEWQGSGMGAYVTACASLELDRCSFLTNGIYLATAKSAYAGKFSGSAICVLSTPVRAKDCRFAGNVGAISGGGDYWINGDGVAGKDGATVFLDGLCGGSVFENCVFTGNTEWRAPKDGANSGGVGDYGGALMVYLKNSSDTVELRNCTVAYNLSQGNGGAGLNIVRGTVNLRDSIIFGNFRGANDENRGADIDVKTAGRLNVAYSLLTSTNAVELTTSAPENVSIDLATTIFGDPEFVTPKSAVDALVLMDGSYYRYFSTAGTTYGRLAAFDVHLKSIGGYLLNDGTEGSYTNVTSRALDAGDPASMYVRERETNGNRVNMGAYGNSAESAITPDGTVEIGEVTVDTESDPGTAIFTIPMTGEEMYLADVWFCHSYVKSSGEGTNGWDAVIDAGKMVRRGDEVVVDLGKLERYYPKDTRLEWRVFAKTAYGTDSYDGYTVIPHDKGAATPAIGNPSAADLETDVGTAIYDFQIGGVGNFLTDVYICADESVSEGEGTNGWKSVELVKAGVLRGENLSAPIGIYFDKGETRFWRIVAMIDGESVAVKEGSVTGVFDLPEYKGKKGPKYVVHLRVGATGNGSGSDWYNACTTLGAALSALKEDETKREIWISGDISVGASASSIQLATPCMIRGGFTTLDEQTPEERAEGARSRIYNSSNSGREFVRTATSASFGCDRIVFDGAKSNALYIEFSGSGSVLSVTDCDFRTNSRLYATGAGGASVEMTRCEFRDCVAQTSAGSALYLASFTGADITDTRFLNNGIPFAQWTSGGDRDVADSGFAVKISSTPTRFTRCDFIGCKATGHNYNQFHSVVGLYGNCHGSELKNCVFSANGFTLFESYSIGDKYSAPLVLSFGSTSRTVLIENCTFAYNFYNNLSGSAGISLNNCAATIRNSVFFGNFHTATSAADLKLFGGATVAISYSMFQATNSEHIAVSSGSVSFGDGMKIGDPEFYTGLDYARAHMTTCEVGRIIIPVGGGSQLTNFNHCASFDLHLKSPTGYRKPGVRRPVRSHGVLSRGIDAGDPASSWAFEPGDNGARVNLGRYGNTSEAESTPWDGSVLRVK